MFALVIIAGILATISQTNCQPPPGNDYTCFKIFFPKYCVEKNETILAALEKCEEKHPKEIKAIEGACIEEIRKEQGKTGQITYTEFRDLECDKTLGRKFGECLNKALTKEKIAELEKIYPPPKLDMMARSVNNCDCDVYNIPRT